MRRISAYECCRSDQRLQCGRFSCAVLIDLGIGVCQGSLVDGFVPRADDFALWQVTSLPCVFWYGYSYAPMQRLTVFRIMIMPLDS